MADDDDNKGWVDAYAARLMGEPNYLSPKPPDVIPNDWGPANALVVQGRTQEPMRPFNATKQGMDRFIAAREGGAPVTTRDLINMHMLEAIPQATQGARDLVNLFMGRPQQEWGTLTAAPDPYNPLLPNGGT